MHYKILVTTKDRTPCESCNTPNVKMKEGYLQGSDGEHVIFATKEGAERYIETYSHVVRGYENPFRIVEFN